nr:hypothetical protein [uncultured Dialister sp.]
MKLIELLDVMDPQMRIEITVTDIDAYGNTPPDFDGKADYIPISYLRRYGGYYVQEISGSLVDESDVKFDKKGGLYFKNAIQIFICKEEKNV